MNLRKRPKCIVHLGQPKTGSTSIQYALSSERAKLFEQGVLFWQGFQPSFLDYWRGNRSLGGKGPGGPFLLMAPFRRQPPPYLTSHGLTLEQYQTIGAQFWRNFESDLIESPAEVVVISSELFFYLPTVPDFIRRLSEHFESIEAIVYLRDPISHYPSAVSTRMRTLTPVKRMVPSEWGGRPVRTLEALQRLSNIPELDGVHLKLFNRERLLERDVVTDFYDVLGNLTNKRLTYSGEPVEKNPALPGGYFAWLLFRSEYYGKVGGEPTPAALRKNRRIVERVCQLDDFRDSRRLSVREGLMSDLLKNQGASAWNEICDRYLGGAEKMDESGSPRFEVTPDSEFDIFHSWIDSYHDESMIAQIDAIHSSMTSEA